jgi:hypothetical protein
MARTTKAQLEAQIAAFATALHQAELRIAELESELEAHRAPAPAQTPKLAAAPAPTRTVGEVLRLALSSKAAAQAAAKDAAMQHKRCTRVIQLPTGEYTWEYYGRKAA